MADPPPPGNDPSPSPPFRRAPAGRRPIDIGELLSGLEGEKRQSAAALANAVGMKLVLIPAGKFRMGSPPEEPGRRQNEGPQHEVTVPQAFYLGASAVTQAQYEAVVGRNPSRFTRANGGGPDHPVENVSWEEAVDFCRKLSALPEEKAAGRIYRLPTEAEWEHSCRAGARESLPFAFGKSLSSLQANFDGTHPHGAAPGPALGQTSPVRSYQENTFGLYDLHGNVWEWCADWYDENYYAESPLRGPSGPVVGRFRVLRGGSWRNHAVTCRSAYRNALPPTKRDSCTGLRVVAQV